MLSSGTTWGSYDQVGYIGMLDTTGSGPVLMWLGLFNTAKLNDKCQEYLLNGLKMNWWCLRRGTLVKLNHKVILIEVWKCHSNIFSSHRPKPQIEQVLELYFNLSRLPPSDQKGCESTQVMWTTFALRGNYHAISPTCTWKQRNPFQSSEVKILPAANRAQMQI